MVYIISGVAFTGNKGASGMAEAIIQNLSARNPKNHFYIYTYYPRQDAKLKLKNNVTLIDATPKAVMLNFFVALWAAFCIRIRLPDFLYKKHNLTKAILESDYWLDTSGISFADGREKYLIYNVLSILPAIILKCRIIKMPQALGPFNNRINRYCSSLVLPKMELICARGLTTCNHLKELNLNNYLLFPDIAFSLQTSLEDKQAISGYIGPSHKRMIGLSPSQVVYRLCETKAFDYLQILKDVTEKLIDKDYKIIVFAHSIRTDTKKTHNNDLPLLEHLAKMLPKHDNVSFVQKDHTAAELRELIGSLDLLIASRFHALISAICTCTPVITLGWSHKYEEVLNDFGISDYGMDYNDLCSEKLLALIDKAEREKKEIILRIKDNLEQKKNEIEELYSLISQSSDSIKNQMEKKHGRK
ncbi:MAG: polysaccharide pyruvyl transferase family protein [Planctomycetota bacterium]|jgi:polysaccharide pyruvyl transferase WcaK-like protein